MRAFGAALALAAVAFLVPLFGFGDEEAAGPPAGMARTEARHASSIPPLKLQLIAISGSAGEVERVFAWRTIFGVRYGTTRVTETSTSSAWSYSPALVTWAVFGVSEVALIGLTVRRALTS